MSHLEQILVMLGRANIKGAELYGGTLKFHDRYRGGEAELHFDRDGNLTNFFVDAQGCGREHVKPAARPTQEGESDGMT